MARTATSNLAIVASVRDEATGPLAQITTAFDGAAGRMVAADGRLAASAKSLVELDKIRLSTAKQVELALRAQAATAGTLEAELVELDRRYEQATAAMAQFARTGREIPADLAAVAAAAKRSADDIREAVAAQARAAQEAAREQEQASKQVAAAKLAEAKAAQAAREKQEQEASDRKAWSSDLVRDLLGASTAVGAVSTAWNNLTSIVQSGLQWSGESIRLAQEQERVERAFVVALRARGITTDGMLAKQQALNAVVQQSTGVGDQQLLQIQAQQVAMGTLPANLEAATKATLGLSAAYGVDLNEAGKKVAQVLGGNVGVLKELGISARTTQEAIDLLITRGYSQAIAQGGTLEGQTKRLGANWTDFREALGGGVTESRNAAAALDTLSGIVQDLGRDAGANKSRVSGFVDTLAGGLNSALTTFRNSREEFLTVAQIVAGGGALGSLLAAARAATSSADGPQPAPDPIFAPPPGAVKVTKQPLTAEQLAKLAQERLALEESIDTAMARLERAAGERYRESVEEEIQIHARGLDAQRRAEEAADTRRRERERAHLEYQRSIIEGAAEIRNRNAEREIEQQKRIESVERERAKAALDAARKQADAGREAGQAVASYLVPELRAAIFESRTLEEALANIGMRLADSLITRGLDALLGAAGAAIAKGPVGGLFDAIGSLFGAARGGIVPGYAGGGIVGGGIDTGRDSVMIAARPGEGVLTPETTRALLRDLTGSEPSTSRRGPQRFASGGVVGNDGAGLQIAIHNNALMLPTQAQLDRLVRQSVAQALRRLERTGAFRLGGG